MSTVRETKFPNGLTVLTEELHNAPVATFWVWYRVGSRNEVPGQTGISHWVEHMMFKGSEQFGTTDYLSEKPYLDQVEGLFEQYRSTTDPSSRKAIYH